MGTTLTIDVEYGALTGMRAHPLSSADDDADDAAEQTRVTGDFAPRWCELFGPVGPPAPSRHTNATITRNFTP